MSGSEYTRTLIECAEAAEAKANAKSDEARRDFAARFDTAANKAVAVAEALRDLAAEFRRRAQPGIGRVTTKGGDNG